MPPRRLSVLLLSLLLGGPALAGEHLPRPAEAARVLMQRAPALADGPARLLVVRPAAWTAGEPRPRLPVLVEAVLSHPQESFEPFPILLSLPRSAEPPAPGEGPCLVVLARAAEEAGGPGELPVWQLQPLSYVGDPAIVFMPLSGPDDPLAGLIREVVFAPAHGVGEPAAWFDRLLPCLSHEDPELRRFAATLVHVSGAVPWTRPAVLPARPDQRDALARLVLDSPDADVRRLLATAYGDVSRERLPTEHHLLERLLGCPDDYVASQVLQTGLTAAWQRAGELADLVRPLLCDDGAPPWRRLYLLRGLRGWGGQALLLQPELEALVHATAAPAMQRRLALSILLEQDAPGAAAMVVQTLDSLPSPAALQYAVEHRLNVVVPAVIEAVRSGRLMWTDAHAAALTLLTGRFPDGKFLRFDLWWAQVESSGQIERMLEADFLDASTARRLTELLDQVRSPRYHLRQAARRELAALEVLAPATLLDATRDPDPEVARTAAMLVVDADRTARALSERLALAAGQDRFGG